MTKGYQFDESTARRIVDVVQQIESVDVKRKTEHRRQLQRGLPIPRWLGVVVGEDDLPDGVDDYDDERYWVQAIRGANTSGDGAEALEVEKIEAGLHRYHLVTATNLGEMLDHSHTVPIGTAVELTETRGKAGCDADETDTPVRRFWFSASTGGTTSTPVALIAIDIENVILRVQQIRKAAASGEEWVWADGFETHGDLIDARPEPYVRINYYTDLIATGDLGNHVKVLQMVEWLGMNIILQTFKEAPIQLAGAIFAQSEGAPHTGG